MHGDEQIIRLFGRRLPRMVVRYLAGAVGMERAEGDLPGARANGHAARAIRRLDHIVPEQRAVRLGQQRAGCVVLQDGIGQRVKIERGVNRLDRHTVRPGDRNGFARRNAACALLVVVRESAQARCEICGQPARRRQVFRGFGSRLPPCLRRAFLLVPDRPAVRPVRALHDGRGRGLCGPGGRRRGGQQHRRRQQPRERAISVMEACSVHPCCVFPFRVTGRGL